jgi:carboxylesterase
VLIALAILGLLTALVTVPVDTTPLESHPHPSTSYAVAVAAYDSVRARERDVVMKDGGSLLYVHGQRTPRAIVLVHGITNSPRQFRELAELFHARGYTVLVPRLPLHGLRGADVERLKSLTAEQYRDYADRSVDIATGLGDSVFVMGLSAGANVAAWIAQHRREVARVVVIAPAISLAAVPAMLDAPMMNAMDRAPNVTIRQQPDTSRPHAYFGVSTRALGETLRFAASVLHEAERGAPVVPDLIVVSNANDRTVDEGPARRLDSLWRARPGTTVRRYRFDKQLALPHDVIDVSQRCGMPALVYPVLIALMEKRSIDEVPAPPARCGVPPQPK